MRTPTLFALLAFLALSLSDRSRAQQARPDAPADEEVTFRTGTNLVVVNLSVKDKNGNTIPGLTARDFTVTENGKTQEIRVFEYQELSGDLLEPTQPALQSREPQPAAAPAAVAPSFSTARPGEVKYKDRRLLVLYFDQAGTPLADQVRSQQAALNFLNNQMTESDMVAVMRYSTDLEILQDFTDDRDELVALIKRMMAADVGMSNGTTGDASEGDTGAAYAQDSGEFNMFNTDRKLAALELAVKRLSALPEKKALVYFASGMSRTGIDNQAQIRSTVNSAIRANVSFYPVDARGLVAMAPAGDATQASQGGQGMFSGNSQRSMQSNFQAQQETLYALAEDTGGKALLDNNDLAMGIVQAQRDISSYYILGYYSTNTNPDGRYRRLKVEVSKSLNAKLDYRTGYFAAKEFKNYSSSDRERQLEEALLLEDPVTDLTIAMEVNYFRQGRDRYFVPISVKIPGSDIELAQQKGSESTRLDFIGEIKDARGIRQGAVRDFVTVKLKGQDVGKLSRQNLEYDTGFTLQPGTYTIKFLARENETGKMGTFETRFVVPDLTNETRYVSLSSVVLSHQREKLDAAVASAEKNKKLLGASPLIHDGQKLIPSVTRVFRQEQEMYIYLEAYQPAAATTEPMLATVSFFRGKVKAFESDPLPITAGLDARSKAVPISISVPLDKLQPARYTCQVTIVNPGAEKFAIWRSSVIVLPRSEGLAANQP